MGLFARVILVRRRFNCFIWLGNIVSVDSMTLSGIGKSTLGGGKSNVFNTLTCDGARVTLRIFFSLYCIN